MRALVALAALLGAASLAASCQTPIGKQPPPSASSPAAQDPTGCAQACADAQAACKSHAPRPVDYCVERCRGAAGVMVGPSLACIAVTFTCQEDC